MHGYPSFLDSNELISTFSYRIPDGPVQLRLQLRHRSRRVRHHRRDSDSAPPHQDHRHLLDHPARLLHDVAICPALHLQPEPGQLGCQDLLHLWRSLRAVLDLPVLLPARDGESLIRGNR